MGGGWEGGGGWGGGAFVILEAQFNCLPCFPCPWQYNLIINFGIVKRTFVDINSRWRILGSGGPKIMLFPLYHHLIHFELQTSVSSIYSPVFIVVLKQQREEEIRDQVPGPMGMPVINEIKFCNVPMLETSRTFSMFIYSPILNDWPRESFCGN